MLPRGGVAFISQDVIINYLHFHRWVYGLCTYRSSVRNVVHQPKINVGESYDKNVVLLATNEWTE